jgi:hypothetical protein
MSNDQNNTELRDTSNRNDENLFYAIAGNNTRQGNVSTSEIHIGISIRPSRIDPNHSQNDYMEDLILSESDTDTDFMYSNEDDLTYVIEDRGEIMDNNEDDTGYETDGCDNISHSPLSDNHGRPGGEEYKPIKKKRKRISGQKTEWRGKTKHNNTYIIPTIPKFDTKLVFDKISGLQKKLGKASGLGSYRYNTILKNIILVAGNDGLNFDTYVLEEDFGEKTESDPIKTTKLMSLVEHITKIVDTTKLGDEKIQKKNREILTIRTINTYVISLINI